MTKTEFINKLMERENRRDEEKIEKDISRDEYIDYIRNNADDIDFSIHGTTI